MKVQSFISQLNNTFNLNIEVRDNTRSSAGSYVDGCILLSSIEVIKTKVRPRSTRANNYGIFSYANSLSYPNVDLIEMTLAHEFGHAIEDAYRKDEQFINCLEIVNKLAPGRVSIYAAHDHPLSIYSEAFAETFALYIIAPQELHNVNIELYNAINDFYISFL